MNPLGALISFAALVALVLSILFIMPRYSCEARWKDSGMPWRWSFLGGCQIQREGNWIPAAAYREIVDDA